MKVMAKPGMMCPTEHNAKMHIIDKPVDVPNTIYYRRLIMDGSLVLVEDNNVQEAPKAKKKEGGN